MNETLVRNPKSPKLYNSQRYKSQYIKIQVRTPSEFLMEGSQKYN